MVRLRTLLVVVLLLTVCGMVLYFLHGPDYVRGGVPFVPKEKYYVAANSDRARLRWPKPNNDVAKFWQDRDHANKGDNPVDDRKEDLSDYSSSFQRVPDVLIVNGRANVQPSKDGVKIEQKTAGRDYPSDLENKRPLQDNRKVTLQEDYYDDDDYKDVPVNRMEGLKNNNSNAQPSVDELRIQQQPPAQDNPSDFENEPALLHRLQDHQKDYDYDEDIMKDANRMGDVGKDTRSFPPPGVGPQGLQKLPGRNDPPDTENKFPLDDTRAALSQNDSHDGEVDENAPGEEMNNLEDDNREVPSQRGVNDGHINQDHSKKEGNGFEEDDSEKPNKDSHVFNKVLPQDRSYYNERVNYDSERDSHQERYPDDEDVGLKEPRIIESSKTSADHEGTRSPERRPTEDGSDGVQGFHDVNLKGVGQTHAKYQEPSNGISGTTRTPTETALKGKPDNRQSLPNIPPFGTSGDRQTVEDTHRDGSEQIQSLHRNLPQALSLANGTQISLLKTSDDVPSANSANISPMKTSDGVPTANDKNISPLKTSDGVPTANDKNISPLKTSDDVPTANDTNISPLKTSDGVPTADGTNISPLKTSDDVPPANGANISPLKTPDGVPSSNGTRMSQGFASRDTNSAPVITTEGGLPNQTSRSSSFEGVKSETVLQVNNSKVVVDNIALRNNPLLFERYHAGNKPAEALTDSSAAHRGLTAQNGFKVPERESTINTIKASLTSQNSAPQDDPLARFGHHNSNDRQKLLEGFSPESAKSLPVPQDVLARGSAQSLEQVPQNDHIPSKSAKPDPKKVSSTNSGTLQETQTVDGFQKLPSDGDTKWYEGLAQSAGRVCISGKQSHNVFVPCSPEQLGPRLLPPESSIIETSTLPKKYNLMPEVSNGHLATVVQSNTIYMNGLYNGANVSSHRARIPSTAAIIATVIFPITGVAKKNYRLDLGRGVFSEVHTGDGFSVEVRRYAHRNLSRLLVTEVVVNRTTSTLPIVLSFYTNAGASSADIDFVQERPGLWNGKTKDAEDANLTGTIPVSVVYTVVPPIVTFHPSTSGTVTFLTAVSISREEALDYYNEGLKRIGQGTLFSSHVNQWDALWQQGRLDLTGNVTMAINTYAAQYYLYSALPLKRDTIWPFVGMAPGGLAHGALGRDYLGHVFWDQDTWMFPGIALLHSDLGRIIADTRIRTLNAAKLNARRAGLQGAWYPTESAVTGTDVDPSKVTADYEIHGNADVSWMMRQYLQLTNDMQFLTLGRGYEAMAAIADYWVSRAVYNQTRGAFEIKGVMGPDELHWPVNNSVYTNADAVDSMRTAQYVARLLRQTPKPMWEKVASSMVINYDPIFKYHTEFDNYTRGSQVKQADTVLMGFPHKWNRTDPVFENDLTYYASVTPGGPAMTWSVFAIGWLRLGRRDKAEEAFYKGTWNIQEPFKVWSEIADGSGAYNFHTGMGGYLQSLLFGYVGVDLNDDHLDLNPQLPPSLTAVAVRGLDYMGSSLDIVYDVQQMNITLTKAGKPLRLTLMKQKKTFDLVLGSPLSADLQPATLSLK